MKFMFPADPMNPRRIDEYFKPQAEALAPEGYCLFSLENMGVRGECDGETVVYRGWMLNTADYNTMRTLVEMQGGRMLTSLGQYLNTHHIPNWYPSVREFTAKTFIIDNMWLNHGCDVVAELKKLGWKKFFLKDFVKSLKTAGGSVVNTPEDAPRVMELMEKYRGTLEGGLVVREFEEGLHDEHRWFVYNKGVWFHHAPSEKDSKAFVDMVDRSATMLHTIAERIDSPFFSVDVALNEAGEVRVVEIGDGQVSDLTDGWIPESLGRVIQMGEREKVLAQKKVLA